MRYELRLTAYDMLDKVHVNWTLYLTEPSGPLQPRAVLSGVESAPGAGVSDPRDWVEDALLNALESL